MKNINYLILAFSLVLFSCSAQEKKSVDPKTFQSKLNDENIVLLDVRTKSEVDGGFIENAINIDYRSADFMSQCKKQISKDKKIMVYCLSGGRSSAAAKDLRNEGYKVIELEGGITKWKNENLPLVTTSNASEKSKGISMSDFTHAVTDSIPVLVDFYAPWCAPCKRMDPILKDFFAKNTGKYKLVKINTDENESLCEEMKIDAIPVLIVFKNGKETWRHLGEATTDEIEQKLNN